MIPTRVWAKVLRTALLRRAICRRKNWRGPTTQGQSSHDLLAVLHPDGVSFRKRRGTESPDRFLGCIGIKSARGSIFCIHRRKCHLPGAFAPSPGWSGRVFGLSGKTPLRLGTWLHGLASLVWVKINPATGAAPVWACLQDRCLCCSAKSENSGLTRSRTGTSPIKSRVYGLPIR